MMAGRFLPRKGFQHVLEALDGISTDFEIHLVGEGPMRAELEGAAAKLPLEVCFHGWLDHDSAELKELYETASIFCLPSQYENASVALLEAMLAGTAVVTLDGTGCRETVAESGVLVPFQDVEALREALRQLFDLSFLRALTDFS